MDNIMKSYRTAARTRITEYLIMNSDRTVSASDILNGLHEEQLDINASTVYRYLDKLIKEGLVSRYASEDGEGAVYQYLGRDSGCDDHLHLKCKACGRIIHLDCDFMDEINEHIFEHHGFRLSCKGSVLYGICAECGERGDL